MRYNVFFHLKWFESYSNEPQAWKVHMLGCLGSR